MKRALWIVGLAACGGGGPPKERSPAEQLFADDPVAVLAGLEERLLASPDVTIEARAVAKGVLAAEIEGKVRVRRDQESTIEVQGTLAGLALADTWTSSKPADADLRDTQPPTWADAILLGTTRMGVMHNWAKVIGGVDPDLAHGDVASWVEVEGVDWKGEPEDRTLTFRIVVGGVDSAEAVLKLDAEGLPLVRLQVVHFVEGDMSVTETYSKFALQ